MSGSNEIVPFDTLSPTKQHETAYKVWASNGRPDLSDLLELLELPTSRFYEISRWKDGTHRCECPWHLWEVKESQRVEEYEDYKKFKVEKNELAKKERLDKVVERELKKKLPKNPDLATIEKAIRSIEPYFYGEVATLSTGEEVTIPRLAPRTLSELTKALETLMKLKFMIQGDPTERIEVSNLDKPVVELNKVDYAAKYVAETETMNKLLGELRNNTKENDE